MTTSLLLIVFAISAGGIVLLAAIIYLLVGRSDVGERLTRYVDMSSTQSQSGKDARFARFSRFRYQMNVTLSMFNSEEFQIKLHSAHWQITAMEYHMIRIAVTFAGFIIGYIMVRNIYAAVALGAIAFIIPGVMLFRAVQKRQRKFQDQLIDSLTLIRGAVAAGSSFLQALDVVVGEMTPPTSEEFARVRREVELGLPLHQALTNLANRMESDDLYLVVSAVTINMQVGGNLSLILESVIETIRNRIYLFSEIRALTSYARYTSYLLSLLPFLTALVLVFISPTYFEQLMRPGITRYILYYALGSLILGNILLRRVSKIEV